MNSSEPGAGNPGNPPHYAKSPQSHITVDGHYVTMVIGAVGDRDPVTLRQLLLGIHPADAADVLEQLPLGVFDQLVDRLGGEFGGEILAELAADRRERALQLMPAAAVARALADLSSDDAALVADDLDEDKLEDVLAASPQLERQAIEESLSFEEETVGRLMQREFVAAPEFWNVGQAIDHMRASGDDLPDDFYEVYVVDPSFRPVGAVLLSKLLRTRREVPLRELMAPPAILVHPDMDQEEVAFAFQKYHLISAPVVDKAGRLNGMLTVDDIVDVIQQENKEDLLALAGVSESERSDNVGQSVRARAPWLMVNLVTATLSASVISLFGATIQETVALASLMPIVASIGGNAGTQALAVAVRMLSQREITAANMARIVGREAMTGAVNGVLIASALALISFIWFHDPRLSTAVGLAVVGNLCCAGLAGVLAPLTLKRIGADPAVASSVFVTFVTDLVGFGVFLWLASIMLAN